MDKILFIDFMNFLYRASIAFRPGVKHQYAGDDLCECKSPWDSEKSICYGEEYLYVYNFFRNLRPIIEQFSPDKCFIVMEGHPKFRYDLFPDYKANRIIKRASNQSSFDKLINSSQIIANLMQYLPLTMARAQDYECDDVIGTLCENLKEEHLTVVSNDSDFIQLLQRKYKNMFLYSANKKEYISAPNYPYVAWKSLNGDKSDNIPGLVKPKKAMLLATNPSEFSEFMKVEENRANFAVNRELIEFSNVPEDEIKLVEGISNFKELKNKFDEMKFESITNEVSWNKFCKTFNCIKY